MLSSVLFVMVTYRYMPFLNISPLSILFRILGTSFLLKTSPLDTILRVQEFVIFINNSVISCSLTVAVRNDKTQCQWINIVLYLDTWQCISITVN